MKTSELIERLHELVDRVGDKDVVIVIGTEIEAPDTVCYIDTIIREHQLPSPCDFVVICKDYGKKDGQKCETNARDC